MYNIFKQLKKIYSYFQIVDIYENKLYSPINLDKKYKLHVYNSFVKIKKKELLNYFKKFQNKKKRFKKKQSFLALMNKDRLLSSGWIFKGNDWLIEEINKKISLKNKMILFDFITPEAYRNKGYYSKLLLSINKKFKGHRLIIYTLQSNIFSKKGIENSGFTLIKTLKRF